MDEIREWCQAQARVVDLVALVTAAEAQTRVPACPDWTVHDLLAHVVGLDADVLAGDEPDDHNSEWTQSQIERRSGRGIGELLEEWRDLRDPLAQWMRDNTTRPLGDVVIHEQDMRGALKVSGGQQTAGLAAIRDTFASRFGDAAAEHPPIALRGPSWSWVSRGEVDDAEVVIEAPDFDLARALMSRRSEAQLRGWTTRGDVTPYLTAFETLGSLPAADLTETF